MSYLTILLHSLAILALLTLITIPPLLFFPRLLKLAAPSFKELKAALGADVPDTGPNARIMVLLSISSIICTFYALTILILPFWPFADFKLLSPFDLPLFLIAVTMGVFLNYIAIWLSMKKGGALFIAGKSAHLAALTSLLVLAVTAPLILAPGSELSAVFAGGSTGSHLWPAWNLWRTPIAAVAFLWLLLELTGAAQNGLKCDLPLKSPLLYMEPFERFWAQSSLFLTMLALMLLFVLIFMGGGADNFILALIPLKAPAVTLLINILAILVKLFILALLLRILSKNYVPQTIAGDIRIIIKYFLPLSVVQIILAVFLRF